MNELSTVMAKLSGIRKAVSAALEENINRARGPGEVRRNFTVDMAGHYFTQSVDLLAKLRQLLPDLFGDFQEIATTPLVAMGAGTERQRFDYSRGQLEHLVRDIDQIFEIRANSELEQPKQRDGERVFITHGRSNDWRAVQAYIEKDAGLPTIELAQEANLGRTIIEKLIDNAGKCNSAVIVMTGDDHTADNIARVRENVMHEIGFFQGRYGRNRVILLHEEGVSIPTNLSGVAYIPHPKGQIEAGFHVLLRELNAIYGR